MLGSRDKETQVIYDTADRLSDEQLEKALRLTLRELSYPEINQRLCKLISSLPEQPCRVDLCALNIYRQALANAFTTAIEGIQEQIQRLAHDIPSNAYNIQSALWELGHHMDPWSNRYQIAYAAAKTQLDPHREHEHPVYNTADLEAEYSRGFEEGYQRALDNHKRSQESEVISQLDID